MRPAACSPCHTVQALGRSGQHGQEPSSHPACTQDEAAMSHRHWMREREIAGNHCALKENHGPWFRSLGCTRGLVDCTVWHQWWLSDLHRMLQVAQDLLACMYPAHIRERLQELQSPLSLPLPPEVHLLLSQQCTMASLKHRSSSLACTCAGPVGCQQSLTSGCGVFRGCLFFDIATGHLTAHMHAGGYRSAGSSGLPHRLSAQHTQQRKYLACQSMCQRPGISSVIRSRGGRAGWRLAGTQQ